MKRKWFAARSSAIVILISALLGMAAPLQVRAGSLLQEGEATWGSFSISPPDSGRLAVLPEPPRDSAKLQAITERAALFSHLSGPTTPMDPNATILDSSPELEPSLPAGESAALAPGSFTIFSNQALSGATGIDGTGQAVSPSAANNGRSIMLSYNYHAALSTDYGSTWGYINPTAVLPGTDGAHGGFAGDQDVLYDPSRDLMVWTLRYIPDATGNQLRLVVLNGSAGLETDPVDYVALTLTPEGKCASTDNADWFDVPQLALTSNFLYVSVNVFRYPANTFTCSMVMRIPLQNLDDGPFYNTLDNYFFSISDRGLTGAHGGLHTFYFAAHADNDTLRIYDWPESAASAAVTSTDVNHASYLTGVVHDCTVTGTGVNPCAADDDRITDGWVRRDLNELAFMWDVPQGTDGKGTFPYPYVRALVVDATTKALVGDDYVWSSDGAFFLPSAAVNARGHVGGTYAFAGDVIGPGTGPLYPQCSAWLYDDVTSETLGDWTLADNAGVTSGAGNPTGNHWGDYLRTRTGGLNPFQWIGTCYAMEGGSPTPRVVRFGRERDTFLPRKSDFDGDARSDPAMFATGTQVLSYLASGSASWVDVSMGPGTYTYVSRSDFDGDGRIDPALFVPAANAVWYRESSTAIWNGVYMGPGTFALQVASDFEADGRTDPARFDSVSNALWFLKSTTGTWDGVYMGPGAYQILDGSDYDGDGKTDPALFFSTGGANALWYRSSRTYFWVGVYMGPGDYTMVPASDFDGDGKTDPALFIGSSNALWYLKSSTSTWESVYMGPGTLEYVAAADFDGDGKTDPAVYIPGTGDLWWFKSTTSTWDGLWMGPPAGLLIVD